MKLPQFRGHLNVAMGGVHHGQNAGRVVARSLMALRLAIQPVLAVLASAQIEVTFVGA